MNPVGWAILGTGNHATHIMAPAIAASDHGFLAAVYSRDQAKADRFATEHGDERTRAYADLDALLADPTVEAVYIGTPNTLHAPHAIACATAGKHVLVDKPLATTIADAEAAIAAGKRAGVVFATGFNVRFHPGHQEARRRITSGEFGDLVLAKVDVSSPGGAVKADWRFAEEWGGGALLNIGPHAVDLLRFITGREVVSVAALTDKSDRPEELAVAALELEGGLYANLTTSRRLPFRSSGITVHLDHALVQTTGTIMYDITGSLTITTANGSSAVGYRNPKPGYNLFAAEIDHLSEVARHGGTLLATGEDGLENLRVLHAMAESAATGRTIRLR